MTIYCFDLDGTIINSSTGIINSINHACRLNHFENINEKELEAKIGPPLKTYLPKILNLKNNDPILKDLIAEFRIHHDSLGYKKYQLYPYAMELLKHLKNNFQNNKIFAVTNKPFQITKKSLEFLNISKFFDDIFSPDFCTDEIINKKINLQRSKKNYLSEIEKKFPLKNKFFIGDTNSDYEATNNNSFIFIFASYGYGEIENFVEEMKIIKSLKEVPKF